MVWSRDNFDAISEDIDGINGTIETITYQPYTQNMPIPTDHRPAKTGQPRRRRRLLQSHTAILPSPQSTRSADSCSHETDGHMRALSLSHSFTPAAGALTLLPKYLV